MRMIEPGAAAFLMGVTLLAVASPAGASEPEANEAPLAAFQAFIGQGLDDSMPWPDRWRAYQEAKPGLDAAREPLVDARRAFDKRNALLDQAQSEEEGAALVADRMSAEQRALADQHDPALWDEYVRYQTALADWIRRDSMPLGGWIMGLFAALLLWGGFAVCVGIARKSDKGLSEPPPDEATWPIRPDASP